MERMDDMTTDLSFEREGFMAEDRCRDNQRRSSQ